MFISGPCIQKKTFTMQDVLTHKLFYSHIKAHSFHVLCFEDESNLTENRCDVQFNFSDEKKY